MPPLLVLTTGGDESVVDYAKGIVNELHAQQVRAEGDDSTDKINGKVQEAEKAKVHMMLAIGPHDVQAGNISVRLQGKGNFAAKPKAEVIADILTAVKERRA